MNGRYNTRSPAVKRLMKEAQELSEPTDQYFAQPLDDNLFEWHFTVRGPADSDFQNGIYHGRIILPVDYPMKPPSIIWLTPNGRFETNKKICLSISGHHPESWQPSWSIRTALLAIIGFMPTHPGGAIGSLDYKPEERKLLAKKSKDWTCPTCGDVTNILSEVSEDSVGASNESKELAAQISFQGEKPKCKEECPVEKARIEETQSQTAKIEAVSQTGTEDNRVDGTTVSNTNTSSVSLENQERLAASSVPLQPTSLPMGPPGMAMFPPMPPMGFAFPYHAMPPMQFPYPPSHYASSGIPPASWSMIPGMAAFPGPFPPPPFPPSPFSVPSSYLSTNNSSSTHGVNLNSLPNNKNTTPSSHNPSTNTVIADKENSNPTTSNDGASANIPSPSEHEVVFKELLSKVKRVGSEAQADQTQISSENAKSLVQDSENSEGSLNSEVSVDKGQEVQTKKEEPSNSLLEGGTDSEMSRSVRKPTKSVSEMGDANTDDSECGVLPIDESETDQRSLTERNPSSSTSKLEKKRQQSPGSKSLRQGQSEMTTSFVSGNQAEEETSAEHDRSEPSATRQRIEAASGDTVLRNRMRQRIPRHNNNQNLPNNNNPLVLQPSQNQSRDIVFYIMAGLLTISVLIILNRLVLHMSWL